MAWAHPQILSMEPPPDARLDAPPARLRITFNEPLESISALALRDARGQEVASGGAPLPADPTTLALDMPPIGPGVYTMVWTVIGDDGHIVKGNAAFTVLGGGAAAAPAGAPTPMPTEPAAAPASPSPAPEPLPVMAIVLRGLMLIGAAAGVGGLAFLAGLVGPAMAATGAGDLRRGRAWLAAPLLLCAAAAALMIAAQAAALGRADLRGMAQVIGTRYGALLAARAGLAVTMAVVVSLPGRAGRLRDGAALALGGLLLISFSLGGHAAAAQSPMLPILADVIHIGVTALWVGGLLAFVLIMPAAMRAAPEGRRPDLLRVIFSRFSTLALASVALITLTGAYAALRLLGSLSDLWTTPYGLSLLAKLLAFGGMLIFGAYNLLVARPGLERWAARAVETAMSRPWPRPIGQSLRAEALQIDAPIGQPTVLPTVTPLPTAAPAPPADAPTPAPLAAVLAPAQGGALSPDLQPIAAQMDSYLSQLAEQGSFSGAALVAYRGQMLVRKGYGLANQELNIPAGAQTRFRLASVSKPLTALAVMQLVQTGRVDLRSSICTYLHDCPSAWGAITVHDLLAHTSGLQNYTDFLAFADVETKPATPDAVIARFRDLPLEFAPGSAYHYTNSNYVLLGRLIEDVSGATYPDYMRDHIFLPLGMMNTGYDTGDAAALSGTRGYIGVGTPATPIDTSNLFAAGGIFSTVDDLYALLNALDDGSLLPADILSEMYTPNFFNYGYGWKIEQRFGHRVIYHPGLMSGAVTYIGRYPDDGLTVIVLSNNENTNAGATADYLAGMIVGH
ncbi:serine hydrolase [Oscillochloris sp. ZM17-4]|uniref:serine hydrolase n=1 Tax=Oscillochloris sp. ZM17-4 TaxID=2866714 RepID=UPI001C738F10|nr:serine hydrolase [Oscillochloris sp. ZM17-4]